MVQSQHKTNQLLPKKLEESSAILATTKQTLSLNSTQSYGLRRT
uniref:Uncharacterized protein n=1 Tax=Arundo donax TaxID=35708 RepID=A0A0A8YHQ0_ARUDO